MGITRGTNVLTWVNGRPEWKHIEKFAATDLVCDGKQWMPCGGLLQYPPATVAEIVGAVASDTLMVWTPEGWYKWFDARTDLSVRLRATLQAKNFLADWPKPLYVRPDTESPSVTHTLACKYFVIRCNIGPMLVYAS